MRKSVMAGAALVILCAAPAAQATETGTGTGAVAGAVGGALVAGPIGALVGGVGGAVIGHHATSHGGGGHRAERRHVRANTAVVVRRSESVSGATPS